jgi:hypothetical protein
LRRGSGVGGDELLLLGEKFLPVSLVSLLFPCLLRPGMELWGFLSGSLSLFLDCLWLGDLEYNNLSPLPLVLLMVLLLLGEGERDSDLDGDGGLDLLLLAGLLHSTLVKLVSVGDLSLFLLPPPLPGLWSAEAFLAPGCGGGLLESAFCLEDVEGPGPFKRWRLRAFFFLRILVSVSALAFLSTSFLSLYLTSVKSGSETAFCLVDSSTLAGAGFPVIFSFRSTMVISWWI